MILLSLFVASRSRRDVELVYVFLSSMDGKRFDRYFVAYQNLVVSARV